MGDTKTKAERQEEWEAEQERLRASQNLPPGATPEQRPQQTISPPGVKGEVQKKLEKAESPLAGNQPAHGFDEHEAARKGAEKDDDEVSEVREEYYPGAHCYVENSRGKGKEHHGRAVGVARGLDPDKHGIPTKYEVHTRDGRAELLIVDAEHLRKVDAVDYHRTQT